MRSFILTLGNELLIGRTINTNATQIALRLNNLGIHVQKIITVGDDLSYASKTLRKIIDERPDLIFITGGLGPTHDDIQLEIVATALNLQLVKNPEAIQMIEDRYHSLNIKMNQSRRKMAYFPEGGIPILNSAGSAPGVRLKFNDTILFSLPGIPREMINILDFEIVPWLRKEFKLESKLHEFGFSLRGVGESTIVGLTEEVKSNHEEVLFKTHPRKDTEGYWLDLHCYLITNNESKVLSAVADWRNKIITKFDVEASEIAPVFSQNFVPEG